MLTAAHLLQKPSAFLILPFEDFLVPLEQSWKLFFLHARAAVFFVKTHLKYRHSWFNHSHWYSWQFCLSSISSDELFLIFLLSILRLRFLNHNFSATTLSLKPNWTVFYTLKAVAHFGSKPVDNSSPHSELTHLFLSNRKRSPVMHEVIVCFPIYSKTELKCLICIHSCFS